MVLPRLGLKDYGFLPRNFLASFAGRGGHVCKYAVGIFRKDFSILMKGKCNWLLILSAFSVDVMPRGAATILQLQGNKPGDKENTLKIVEPKRKSLWHH